MAVRVSFPRIIVRGLTRLLGEVEVRGVPLAVPHILRARVWWNLPSQSVLAVDLNTFGVAPFLHPQTTGVMWIRAPFVFNESPLILRVNLLDAGRAARFATLGTALVTESEACLKLSTFTAAGDPTNDFMASIEADYYP